MSGNTFGVLFTVTTYGESHGAAYGCVVDGCPPGLALGEADIQADLDRRRPGQSPYVTQRREADRARILSGVFEGRTLGTPIGVLIENEDARSSDYEKLRDLFRPGHADYTYEMKYGRRDHRGGGRASARETCVRVAAGAIAKKYLAERYGVRVRGYLAAMGDMDLKPVDIDAARENMFFCPEPDRLPDLEARIKDLRRQGDSIGARVNVVAEGLPAGWGEPVFDRLDADIAKAMMSVNAVRGVEVGDGFRCVAQKGSEHRDEMTPEGFLSNHAGGVLGGLSTGQAVTVSLALKPTSSIPTPGRSIDAKGEAAEVVTTGRHDPCVGLRAVPIAEAMMALVLMDHALRHRAQNEAVRPRVPPLPPGAPS